VVKTRDKFSLFGSAGSVPQLLSRESQAMDWETLYCPHRHCRGYGKPFSQGYLVKNGTSRGQPRAWCTAGEARVVLRYGTAYDGLEAAPVVFETAVRALAEGNALRATARIVHVDKETVCPWLHRVACHCRTIMLYFWRDLHVNECQLDELWSFVHTKEAHLVWSKYSNSPSSWRLRPLPSSGLRLVFRPTHTDTHRHYRWYRLRRRGDELETTTSVYHWERRSGIATFPQIPTK
jgi:transposase-like protein